MRSWILMALVGSAGVGALWAGGQSGGSTVGTANDEAGVRQAAAALVAAMQAGDAAALANYWAEDAEYTDDSGNPTKGRAAVVELYKPTLAEYKAGKLTGKVDKLRFLTPDVAIMDGTIEFTPASGAADRNRFSATWTRKNNRWQIASARDLPEVEGELADRGMEELKWLVGDWTADDKGTSIRLSVRPDLDKKFLRMDFTIKSAAGEFRVVQYAGFDPIEGVLRTWTFDSRGGFGQGMWTREASIWQGETDAVLPTGQYGSAVNFMRMSGPDGFVWQATEREVEGQPIPDAEIKYTRVQAAR
jgi:uncharacterized protein (TIGR02246 family)